MTGFEGFVFGLIIGWFSVPLIVFIIRKIST